MRFEFTSGDLHSSLWFRLNKHLEERRQELRTENDSMNLDERRTAEKRGRIAEITELLDSATNPGDTP